jgi:hypothetical protein
VRADSSEASPAEQRDPEYQPPGGEALKADCSFDATINNESDDKKGKEVMGPVFHADSSSFIWIS